MPLKSPLKLLGDKTCTHTDPIKRKVKINESNDRWRVEEIKRVMRREKEGVAKRK